MKTRKNSRGQAMVEFALVFPIFVLLLVGIFDFGRAIWVNDTLSTATREAVRYAVVHGGSPSTTCPAGPPGPNSNTEESADCPPYPNGTNYPLGSRQAIKDVAQRWAAGASSGTTVSVCYGIVATCAGDVDEVGATNAPHTPVTVTVTATVGLAVPSLFGFDSFTFSSSSTMLVNN